jgi:hypothetical protein
LRGLIWFLRNATHSILEALLDAEIEYSCKTDIKRIPSPLPTFS